jgi:hypothetical protein
LITITRKQADIILANTGIDLANYSHRLQSGALRASADPSFTEGSSFIGSFRLSQLPAEVPFLSVRFDKRTGAEVNLAIYRPLSGIEATMGSKALRIARSRSRHRVDHRCVPEDEVVLQQHPRSRLRSVRHDRHLDVASAHEP